MKKPENLTFVEMVCLVCEVYHLPEYRSAWEGIVDKLRERENSLHDEKSKIKPEEVNMEGFWESLSKLEQNSIRSALLFKEQKDLARATSLELDPNDI